MNLGQLRPRVATTHVPVLPIERLPAATGER